jgi:hypothetical protein
MLVVSVTRVLAYQLNQGCANTPATHEWNRIHAFANLLHM